MSFALSRLKFKAKKGFLRVALVLGMFPGFMSMIAIYYIFKAVGLTQSLAALVLAYSGASGLGFYICKGFFDTIPKTLDEAARLDGATWNTVFTRITLPTSKPIIIYTVLMGFLAPWGDFIFVSVIMVDKAENFTVAYGLYKMITDKNFSQYFHQFFAGATIVAVIIAALFIWLQRYYVAGITGGAVKG